MTRAEGAVKDSLSCGAPPRRAPQHCLQDDSVIHMRVARSVEQRYALSARPLSQRLQPGRVCTRLGTIALANPAPTRRIMVEPLTQRRARCEIGPPLIECHAPFAEA